MTDQVVQEEATQEQPKTKPELNLNDLVTMRNVIDVVTQRGAFKANELTAVGVLFDRINAFLEASQPAQAQAETEGE